MRRRRKRAGQKMVLVTGRVARRAVGGGTVIATVALDLQSQEWHVLDNGHATTPLTSDATLAPRQREGSSLARVGRHLVSFGGVASLPLPLLKETQTKTQFPFPTITKTPFHFQ